MAAEADFDVDTQQSKVDEPEETKAEDNKATAQSAKKDNNTDESAKGDAKDDTEKTNESEKPAEASKDKNKDQDEQDKDEDDGWGDWRRSNWQWSKSSNDEGGETEVEPCSTYQRRPVHEKLCYVLPDRTKKACLTWEAGVELYTKEVGHAPVWADHKIECKVCKKFFKGEVTWQVHFVERHSDK